MAQLFVITLDNLKRTPTSTKNVIQKYQLNHNYTSVGLDGRFLDIKDLQNQKRMSLIEFIVGGELSVGEVGCLLSHQLIYEDIVANQRCSTLILEDDAEVLINYSELEKITDECEKSGFEIVSFYSPKGAVSLDTGSSILKTLVPGIYALAYWVSKSGAEKLLAKNYLLGLADWPVNIANIKFGYYRSRIVANSGTENSFIYPTLGQHSHTRANIANRPLKSFLNKGAIKSIKLMTHEVGLMAVFKYIFVYRILRRLARVITRNKKGLNNSIILKVRNYGLA
jgi:GR25 family glycosyltransferase involved in LPS biosynthesis